MLAIVEKYVVDILIYFVYLSVQGALCVTGIVLFFVNIRKIRFEKANMQIDSRTRRRVAVLNAGVIASTVLLLALTISTLFLT